MQYEENPLMPETKGNGTATATLRMSTIVRFWFPLAASWLLMSTETPIVTAFVARMPDAKTQLAAFGIAISLALAAESPIISMLTVANALARDRASLRLSRAFMYVLCAAVTTGIVLLAVSPLFDIVVLRLIGAPPPTAKHARDALLAMLLWPAAIAYRRYHQGLMIRLGQTRPVTYGTIIRLCTTLAVSAAGFIWGRLSGATVAGVALCCAVVAEAAYIHYASRLAVRQIQVTPSDSPSLSLSELVRFYAPLALTSTVMLSTTPILNSGLARSPSPMESLAVWPVVNGQLFITRSLGYSLQEVVVALLSAPGADKPLRRFSVWLGLGSLFGLLGFAFTPFGSWWQQRVAGLGPDLIVFALLALRSAALLPGLAVLHSWLRGIIVTGKATGSIAGATVVNLVVLGTTLLCGSKLGWLPGASLAAVALTLSQLAESVWLWRGARRRSSLASLLGDVQA